MRITGNALFGFASVVAIVFMLAAPASVAAQSTPPPNDQAQAQVRSPIEGDLLSVDPEAKTIKVKTLTGTELQFSYDDKTEISGSQKDAAGLATASNARVTVHFTEDASTKARNATRIMVQPKK